MKKTHKKILFIILAVLIICGGIVVYWKFNNPSPSQCGFPCKKWSIGYDRKNRYLVFGINIKSRVSKRTHDQTQKGWKTFHNLCGYI